MNNFLVAVLSDRAQAEKAHATLEHDGMPADQISIVGQGYKDIGEYGFLDPQGQARKRALTMMIWLVPFGFLGGFAFNVSTQFELFEWAGVWGNHLFGGVFGAIAGAMGSFFVGGGTTLILRDGDAFPYRDKLKQGQYVLIVQGAPNLTNRANRLLRQMETEHLEGYVAPGSF